MKRVLLLVVFVAAAFAPGCRIFRHSPAPPPPPPPRALVQPPAKTAVPQPLPEPPQLATGEQALPAEAPPIEQEWPGPPRRPRRPRPAPATEEAEAPEVVPAAPAPELAQILTPEQETSYNAAIDRNLDRAQRTAHLLRSRKLSRDQAVYLERITSFIQQANEARKTDLVRAANLAERAAVLADDLLRSLR